MKSEFCASVVMQYLLHGREGTLLLLLQNFNLLEQTASFQTQPSNFLKHFFILCLKQTKTNNAECLNPRNKAVKQQLNNS